MKRIKIITSKGELTFEVDKEEVFIDCPECHEGIVTYEQLVNGGSSMADASTKEVQETCSECDGDGWINLNDLI